MATTTNTTEPSDEELQTQFLNNFKIKDASFFSGATGKQEMWPRVLAYNDREIPLKFSNFDKTHDLTSGGSGINVNFTIIDCIGDGFTMVPYTNKNNKTKMGDNPKKLSEIGPHGKIEDFSKIMCWPYTIVMGASKVCIFHW